MKGLVSFSLFGDNPIYTMGALRNVEIWQDSPFDVDCRFYVGKSVPKYVIHALELDGAEVIPFDGPEDQTATFWRYEAFNTKGYDYILSRDTDSRPYEREFYAIQEFLDSGAGVHIIRDHPFHGVKMLAGLFGVSERCRAHMADRLPSRIPDSFYRDVNRVCTNFPIGLYESNDFYQVDQWWLRINVYPYFRNLFLAHDEFFGMERKRYKRGFPPREDLRFVGEGFDENDNPRFIEHRDFIQTWPHRPRR